MTRVAPRSTDDLAEYADGFALIELFMGFVPSSLRVMARVPGLLDGMTGLSSVVFLNDLLPVRSSSSSVSWPAPEPVPVLPGAHRRERGTPRGGPGNARRPVVVRDERTVHRRGAGRIAARVGLGQSPNAVTDADFAECRRHYTDDQITAIVAVCALFGYLNRWNETMATTLESVPRAVATDVLTPQGWTVGKHE